MTSEQAAKRRAELTNHQHPFAIVLSCSDSRVPPEIVFMKASETCSLFESRAMCLTMKDGVASSTQSMESKPKADLDAVIKATVQHAVDALRWSTPILKGKDSGDVQVIGGYYTLDTGTVTFLDQK